MYIRKYISLLLIVTILGAFGLAGCNNDEKKIPQNNGETKKQAQQPTDKKNYPKTLTVGTNTVGSAWYSMGAGLAGVLSKYLPGIKVTAAQTAASVENLKGIKDGILELGLASGDTPYNMYRGIGYEENKDFSFLANNDLVCNVFIVKKNSPIKTIEDMKGKRIGTGLPGSSSYVLVQRILEAHGITYDDVKTFPAGVTQQCDALKDGNLDVVAVSIGGPATGPPALLNLDSTTDIRFIPLSDEVLDKLVDKYPSYQKSELRPGWVNSIKEPVRIMAVRAMVFVKKDLPEDLVYDICKIMFEHKDELIASYSQWEYTRKEDVAINMPVPIHPGAEKYYREIGAPISYLKEAK